MIRYLAVLTIAAAGPAAAQDIPQSIPVGASPEQARAILDANEGHPHDAGEESRNRLGQRLGAQIGPSQRIDGRLGRRNDGPVVARRTSSAPSARSAESAIAP